MAENIDRAVEEQAMRRHGLIGRGDEMGNKRLKESLSVMHKAN